jgi:hypothetical protein
VDKSLWMKSQVFRDKCRRIVAAALTFVSIAVASGCSQIDNDVAKPSALSSQIKETGLPGIEPGPVEDPGNGSTEYMPAPTATYTGPIPEFSGPWAAEFREAYSATQTELGRSILADETITTAEINEILAQHTKCLSDLGFSEIHFEPNGRGDVKPPAGMQSEQVNRLVGGCVVSTDFGKLGFLYSAVQGNPQNVEQATIMSQCYVRVGLRQEGYTAADYKREFESNDSAQAIENLPYDQKMKVMACNDDPAHAK